MASVGFEGAWGNQAMADQVRQRIMDELSQAKDAHTMGIQDAELKLRQDEAAQNAQDRAAALQERGLATNEKIAGATATNLGPGQTIISPELANRFAKTSLAPLVQQDQSLPSTQLSAGMAAPQAISSMTGNAPDAAPAPSTAPTVTNQAQKLTGQLRFMGTPAANKEQADEAAISQMASDPKTPPAIRGFLQMRQGLPKGENIPYQLITEPNGPPKAAEPLEQVNKGGKAIYVPRSQAVGAEAFHAPQQPTDSDESVQQSGNGFVIINKRTGVSRPVSAPAAAGPNAPPQLQTKVNPQIERQQKAAEFASGDVNSVLDNVDAAEKAGLLGPASGRLYGQFLAGTVGSTGDPKIDEALGGLKASIKDLNTSYPMAISGNARGGGGGIDRLNSVLNSDKFSPDLMRGALHEINGALARRNSQPAATPGGGNETPEQRTARIRKAAGL